MSTQDRISAQNRDSESLNYLESQVLLPGEKVVWKGRPDGTASAKVGIFQFFFGIFFFAFSVFWMYMAFSMDGGLFALFGIPFVAIGFWMVSSPVRQYLHAGKTYYAITDKRVIILTRKGEGYIVNPITAEEMADYQRIDAGNGTGSIRLKTTVRRNSEGTSTTTEVTDGLWGIHDVRGAAEAIAKLRTGQAG